ncbi:MAG: hypothetical protein BAJALOKI3v1_370020 [Promethearchaeota archaeon]|nr:MAG: hypothetical protein BAJALOKI3v1_370020 [Candidatus Lokiarchaeota archaeon]
MSVNNPNLIERINKIESRLDELERRISNLEKLLRRTPGPSDRRPFPGKGPKPPEPFKF